VLTFQKREEQRMGGLFFSRKGGHLALLTSYWSEGGELDLEAILHAPRKAMGKKVNGENKA